MKLIQHLVLLLIILIIELITGILLFLFAVNFSKIYIIFSSLILILLIIYILYIRIKEKIKIKSKKEIFNNYLHNFLKIIYFLLIGISILIVIKALIILIPRLLGII